MSTPARRRGERRDVGRTLPVVALVCLLGGCAARPAPAPKTVAAAEPSHPVRLAWFPVESLGSPEIAGVINASLARLKVAGSTESFKAAVSMEIAQLTIECVQPTAGCYAAVGRSVKADRLLWVGMDPAGPTGKAIRITLALFDVQGGTFDRRPERTFASVAEARQSLAAFIENALAGGETLSAPRPAVAVRTPAP